MEITITVTKSSNLAPLSKQSKLRIVKITFTKKSSLIWGKAPPNFWGIFKCVISAVIFTSERKKFLLCSFKLEKKLDDISQFFGVLVSDHFEYTRLNVH